MSFQAGSSGNQLVFQVKLDGMDTGSINKWADTVVQAQQRIFEASAKAQADAMAASSPISKQAEEDKKAREAWLGSIRQFNSQMISATKLTSAQERAEYIERNININQANAAREKSIRDANKREEQEEKNRLRSLEANRRERLRIMEDSLKELESLNARREKAQSGGMAMVGKSLAGLDSVSSRDLDQAATMVLKMEQQQLRETQKAWADYHAEKARQADQQSKAFGMIDASLQSTRPSQKSIAQALAEAAKDEENHQKKSKKAWEDYYKDLESKANAGVNKIRTIQERLRASTNEMREGFALSAEAVLRMGRGIAYLGAANEESQKKMLETMMKIEASWNILKGGIDIFHGLSKAAQAYRMQVDAVAASQAVQATIQAATQRGLTVNGITPGTTSAAGVVGTGAAHANTIPLLGRAAQMIASHPIGAVAAIGGLALGAASTKMGGDFVADTVFNNKPAYKIMSYLSRHSSSGLAGDLYRPYMNRFESDKKTLNVTNRRIAAEEMRDRLNQQAGINQHAETERLTNRLEMSDTTGRMNVLRGAGSFLQQADRIADNSSTSAQAAIAATRALHLHDVSGGLSQMDTVSKMRAASLAERLSSSPLDYERRRILSQSSAVGDELSMARQQQSALTESSPDKAREEINNRVSMLMQKQLELSKEMANNEKEAAQTKHQYVAEAVAGTREELNMRQQMINAEKDKLLSAKQRFGAMSPMEQEIIRRSAQSLREANDLEENAEGMNPAQRKKMLARAESIRGGIGREELNLLKGLGTEDGFANKELERRAEAGGFGDVAKTAEGNIDLMEKAKNRVAEQLTVQRELLVRVEADSDEQINRVADVVAKQLYEQDQALDSRINQRVKQLLGDANRTPQSQLLNGAAGNRLGAINPGHTQSP